ncbi:hypothetical protein BV25DRAFT_1842043 [Artomyces pyxidatus]|uniref:Uncharacterized protein n=2 Tax=Artomyces pyxidatus TaxID=48021 RepID=A0ACB8SEG4_9AGAM|nr:hypothetical protein BV25DRAFT_1922581 [Artomyces pyxidatus]KAI0056901.1 hypothetical protein BV25DRAFT_1842043 [Artomyces pyxidatus]
MSHNTGNTNNQAGTNGQEAIGAPNGHGAAGANAGAAGERDVRATWPGIEADGEFMWVINAATGRVVMVQAPNGLAPATILERRIHQWRASDGWVYALTLPVVAFPVVAL